MESIFGILNYAFWVLVAITILVFIHELGHFLAAKLFGMRVDRFSIGFPPNIFGKQIGETEYVVGATPLGGYVKIAGMVDESMDTEHQDRPPEPYEYRAKPVWQRMIVITAGVIFNVLLAVAIFAGLKMSYGETYVPADQVEAVYVEEGTIADRMGLETGDRIVAVSGEPLERFDDLARPDRLMADRFTITVERSGARETLLGPSDIGTQLSRTEGGFGVSFESSVVGGLVEDAPAARAGLMPGDRIVAVDGEPVRFWRQLTQRIETSEGQPLLLRWERPDSLIEQQTTSTDQPYRLVEVTDRAHVYEGLLEPEQAEDDGRYVIGIYGPSFDEQILRQEYGITTRTYGLAEATAEGAQDAWMNTRAIAVSLQRLVTGREGMDSIGGPVMVAKVAGDAAAAGADRFWFIVAILSVTLAIVNILPIPALDGGHLMFLIYEALTRREPSLRVRMALQQIGMVLLLLLMVFLVFHDIFRLF